MSLQMAKGKFDSLYVPRMFSNPTTRTEDISPTRGGGAQDCYLPRNFKARSQLPEGVVEAGFAAQGQKHTIKHSVLPHSSERETISCLIRRISRA